MVMPPEYLGLPYVSVDIPWEYIEGEFLRIAEFTPLATVEGEKVRAERPPTPYALLKVESPKLEEAVMPVAHREDFRKLWQIYRQRGVTAEEEVLLTYYPRYKGLLRLANALAHLRKFAISIYPKGSLEKMYEVLAGEAPPQELPRALYKYIPLERYR
jgi:hypothetical protein